MSSLIKHVDSEDEPAIKLDSCSEDTIKIPTFKKEKRERYCSDLTSASRSGLLSVQKEDKKPILAMVPCNSSPTPAPFAFDDFFKLEPCEDNFDDNKSYENFAFNNGGLCLERCNSFGSENSFEFPKFQWE